MKKNLLFMYFMYVIVVCLVWLIDIPILLYYVFWINNIFIYPLI